MKNSTLGVIITLFAFLVIVLRFGWQAGCIAFLFVVAALVLDIVNNPRKALLPYLGMWLSHRIEDGLAALRKKIENSLKDDDALLRALGKAFVAAIFICVIASLVIIVFAPVHWGLRLLLLIGNVVVVYSVFLPNKGASYGAYRS